MTGNPENVGFQSLEPRRIGFFADVWNGTFNCVFSKRKNPNDWKPEEGRF
jgi:hypothetical protein